MVVSRIPTMMLREYVLNQTWRASKIIVSSTFDRTVIVRLEIAARRDDNRAAAPAPGGPIDHQVLGRLLCNDPTSIAEVMRQFLAACPGDAKTLGEAVSAGDSQSALRCAHRLKGASRMVGAEPLADICERIERTVKAGDRRLAAAVAQLEREAARVEEYLRIWFKAGN